MNKKGEANVLVGLILLAMILFIGFALLTPVATTKGEITNLGTSANVSYTLGASGSTSDLTPCGQANASAVVIYNPAGDYVLPAANYTVSRTTASRIYLTSVNSTYASTDMNVSCSYEPVGYLDSSGDRSLFGLIQTMMIMVLLITAALYAMKQFQE